MPEADALADKFVGCLLGCAIGDALGMPTEGMSRREIEMRYGRVTEFRAGAGLEAGQYTDDTQMMLCLAEQIAEDGEFNAAAAARRFVWWYHDRPRRPGRACMDACKRLIAGAPWSESGGEGEAGCGTAMRVMPIGLRYFRDPVALRRAAVESAVITHRDARAMAGAVAIAYGVARALCAGEAPDGDAFLGEVADFVADVDGQMAAAIGEARRLLSADPWDALGEIGTGVFVLEAVPAALYCFARSLAGFSTPLPSTGLEAAVVLAANAGGDTDSVAAMAGSLSGALNGVGRIPPRFRDNVESAEHLRKVALRLHGHAVGSVVH